MSTSSNVGGQNPQGSIHLFGLADAITCPDDPGTRECAISIIQSLCTKEAERLAHELTRRLWNPKIFPLPDPDQRASLVKAIGQLGTRARCIVSDLGRLVEDGSSDSVKSVALDALSVLPDGLVKFATLNLFRAACSARWNKDSPVSIPRRACDLLCTMKEHTLKPADAIENCRIVLSRKAEVGAGELSIAIDLLHLTGATGDETRKLLEEVEEMAAACFLTSTTLADMRFAFATDTSRESVVQNGLYRWRIGYPSIAGRHFRGTSRWEHFEPKLVEMVKNTDMWRSKGHFQVTFEAACILGFSDKHRTFTYPLLRACAMNQIHSSLRYGPYVRVFRDGVRNSELDLSLSEWDDLINACAVQLDDTHVLNLCPYGLYFIGGLREKLLPALPELISMLREDEVEAQAALVMIAMVGDLLPGSGPFFDPLLSVIEENGLSADSPATRGLAVQALCSMGKARSHAGGKLQQMFLSPNESGLVRAWALYALVSDPQKTGPVVRARLDETLFRKLQATKISAQSLLTKMDFALLPVSCEFVQPVCRELKSCISRGALPNATLLAAVLSLNSE